MRPKKQSTLTTDKTVLETCSQANKSCSNVQPGVTYAQKIKSHRNLIIRNLTKEDLEIQSVSMQMPNDTDNLYKLIKMLNEVMEQISTMTKLVVSYVGRLTASSTI
ncbi:hypothetical protein EAG_07645 [Camponotus floridanus]|uniref:Uncharacterized protein n=1 Tax=Camponotus floridanus TaxID=104421 RepID=E2AQ34_CAMFO|nr:hypothetical protein EAG_07645 [Camponotus floridanus]